MRKRFFSLILILFFTVFCDKSYSQECTALAENTYCVDGTLCHADAPFPVWSGAFGRGNYFINGNLGDSKSKAGIRLYFTSKPKKTLSLNTEVEVDDVQSGQQVYVTLEQGMSKLYATGDQAIFCTLNDDGTITLKAEKLAMAKGRGKKAEVINYISFNIRK
jgi:hypothetical protein